MKNVAKSVIARINRDVGDDIKNLNHCRSITSEYEKRVAEIEAEVNNIKIHTFKLTLLLLLLDYYFRATKRFDLKFSILDIIFLLCSFWSMAMEYRQQSNRHWHNVVIRTRLYNWKRSKSINFKRNLVKNWTAIMAF